MMKELLFEHDSPAAAWFAKASELTALSPCTSPVAKVDHFLGLLPELQIVLSKSNKSLEKALQFKEEGNALYKEGKYREARDAYTRSVQLFPVNYDRLDGSRKNKYLKHSLRCTELFQTRRKPRVRHRAGQSLGSPRCGEELRSLQTGYRAGVQVWIS